VRFGVHVSIAGGLVKAVERAKEKGCEAIQVFLGSPRGWKSRPLVDEEIEGFRRSREEVGIYPVVVHTSYLLNLASEGDLYEMSKEALREEMRKAKLLGMEFVVTHIGHLKPGMERGKGRERVVAAIERAIEIADEGWPKLLLENVTGSESAVGASFEEIGRIMEGVGMDERVGVCMDTCHAFANGYDLRNPEGLEMLLEEIRGSVGIDRLLLIHANDSKAPLGSRKDRHEHIGKGEIGLPAFEILVNHAALSELPCILETPVETEEDDKMNLAAIRSVYHGKR
jgi:deoxyribonuclease-4